MVKIIFVCLVLALGLWGCDDDGKGRPIIDRPCQDPSFWTNETCFAPNIVLPPGLCEPLLCETEEFEFLILPQDAICNDPDDCITVSCNDGNLIFMNLALNENGDLEGILAEEGEMFSFVCFID